MRELQPCGTEAAYKRHTRRGEKTCKACRAAQARASKRKRKGTRAKPRQGSRVDWDAAIARFKADMAVRYADEGNAA